MAMGLSGASLCDFVVYTFKGLIIARTKFDNEYFLELLDKLNSFYSQARISRSRISRIFYKSDKFAQSRSACYKSYTFSVRMSDFISRIFA